MYCTTVETELPYWYRYRLWFSTSSTQWNCKTGSWKHQRWCSCSIWVQWSLLIGRGCSKDVQVWWRVDRRRAHLYSLQTRWNHGHIY